MAHQPCLGIFCTAGRLTAAFVDKPEGKAVLVTVTAGELPEEHRGDPAALARRLADQVQRVSGRKRQVVLSLADDYYQSQSYSSQFTDLRQIRQTIRFDIEEEFAIDAEGVTVAFTALPSDQAGTRLMVYTGQTVRMRALFDGFEAAGLDAIAAEPDIESWRHWLDSHLPRTGDGAVVMGRQGDTLYLMILSGGGQPEVMRSFPASPGTPWAAVAAAEIRRSMMALEQQPKILYYHTSGLDPAQMEGLARPLGFLVKPLESVPLDQIFATGVATGRLTGAMQADFRQDNLPSRLVRSQARHTLLTAAAGLCAFLLVWIAVAYAHSRQYESFGRQAVRDVETAWRKAVPNQQMPRANVDKNLETELTKLRRQFRGQQTEFVPDSASNTLSCLLLFLNRLPDDIELQIDKISVNPDSVYAFSGSIKDLAAFDRLREMLRESGLPLEIDRSSFEPPSATSRSFSMPLKLTKTVQPEKNEPSQPNSKISGQSQ